MSDWVHVKDQLPPDEDRVLVYTATEMFVAMRWRGQWLNAFEQPLNEMYDSLSGDDISHWMSLPKPPKG